MDRASHETGALRTERFGKTLSFYIEILDFFQWVSIWVSRQPAGGFLIRGTEIQDAVEFAGV